MLELVRLFNIFNIYSRCAMKILCSKVKLATWFVAGNRISGRTSWMRRTNIEANWSIRSASRSRPSILIYNSDFNNVRSTRRVPNKLIRCCWNLNVFDCRLSRLRCLKLRIQRIFPWPLKRSWQRTCPTNLSSSLKRSSSTTPCSVTTGWFQLVIHFSLVCWNIVPLWPISSWLI